MLRCGSGIVDVTQIDQDRRAHHRAKTLEIQRAEGVPLGHDDDGVGIFCTGIGILGESHRRQERAGLLDSLGIIGAHLGASVLKPGRDGQRGRLAHVVRIRLEGQAEEGNRLAAHGATAGTDHLTRHGALALVVHGDHRLHDAERHPIVLGGLGQGQGVLGEARAAIARPGMEELRADAPVEADAARHLLHVRAHRLAQVGHLVDEGDLHREERVGGVFGQLGRATPGHEDRRGVEIERAVDLPHHRLGAGILGADDDPVRALEVADRRALTQEFGVRDHGEVGLRRGLADDALDLVARAHRHRRLGDDHRVARQRPGDLAGRVVDEGEVREAVAPAGGGPTAMNTASAPATASRRSVRNESRPWRTLSATRDSSPARRSASGPVRGRRSCPGRGRCRRPRGRNPRDRRRTPARHNPLRSSRYACHSPGSRPGGVPQRSMGRSRRRRNRTTSTGPTCSRAATSRNHDGFLTARERVPRGDRGFNGPNKSYRSTSPRDPSPRRAEAGTLAKDRDDRTAQRARARRDPRPGAAAHAALRSGDRAHQVRRPRDGRRRGGADLRAGRGATGAIGPETPRGPWRRAADRQDARQTRHPVRVPGRPARHRRRHRRGGGDGPRRLHQQADRRMDLRPGWPGHRPVRQGREHGARPPRPEDPPRPRQQRGAGARPRPRGRAGACRARRPRRGAEGGTDPGPGPGGLWRRRQTYNVNADTFAGAIAGALRAKRLLLLTDVPGVLDKDKKLIPELTVEDCRRLIADGTITGGMIPKIETCMYALDRGVEAVVILDGKVNHAVLLELFTNYGAGTLIRRG
ncbi:hypothetical protein Lal_00046477 [Lupinus albus]|nr:hypothetical protein Lal_00046477 [Lupinus albus]